MRRALKFFHTLGAVGLMGAMAALLAMHAALPPVSEIAAHVAVRQTMRAVADWVFMPSLALVLLAGLSSIAAVRAYQDVGWVWVKLATGVLVFEGSLVAIHGPIRREAELSQAVLAGEGAVSALAANLSGEWWALWLMMAVAVLNVGLGVWRPRFRFRREAGKDPAAEASVDG